MSRLTRLSNEVLKLLVVIILLVGSGLSYADEPIFAADGEQPPAFLLQQIDKGNPKLDSRLNQMASAGQARALAAQANSLNVSGESVRVIIEASDSPDGVAKELGSRGIVETSYGNLLQVSLPVTELAAVAELPGVKFVRMPLEAVEDTVTSQGVVLINADDWQTAGYTGTGVKIAVASTATPPAEAKASCPLALSTIIRSTVMARTVRFTAPPAPK